MKGHRRGAHWRYRVWDPHASWQDSRGVSRIGRYRRAVFYDHAENDKDRREPGCAEGDKWSKQERAKFQLGQLTASQANLSAVSAAYIQELRESRAHVTTLRNVELARGGAGDPAKATDLSAKDFAHAHVASWLGSLENVSLQSRQRQSSR